MRNEKDKRDDRSGSYPQPSKTDTQLANQPEYIDQEPNEFKKEISDVPAEKSDVGERQPEDAD